MNVECSDASLIASLAYRWLYAKYARGLL